MCGDKVSLRDTTSAILLHVLDNCSLGSIVTELNVNCVLVHLYGDVVPYPIGSTA